MHVGFALMTMKGVCQSRYKGAAKAIANQEGCGQQVLTYVCHVHILLPHVVKGSEIKDLCTPLLFADRSCLKSADPSQCQMFPDSRD